MNLFLRTRTLRNIVSYNPDALRLEYENAYSLIPGKIHVRNLMIRGRGGDLEWILRIERCEFWVSFVDLARRTFHARHVEADGLTFRIRLRVAIATPAHDAALPPIPGCADPPYRDSGPPRPPLTDAQYNLWSVQLDDVDANHVQELWIDTIRYSGDLRVRGRWLFRPRRWLEVGPAGVDVRTLQVSYGQLPFATGLQGTIETTVHPFDVRVPKGLEILDHVSARVTLYGRLRVADALSGLWRANDIVFARGEGPFDARVAVDHGVLLTGTHLAAEAPDNKVIVAGNAIEALARAELDVRGGPADTTAILAIDLSKMGVVSPDGASARVDAVTATLTSRALDLSHAFTDTTFAADVRGLKISALGSWVPSSAQFRVLSGDAGADAHFQGSLAEKRAEGDLTLSVGDLSASGDYVSLSGSASAKIRFDELSLEDKLVSMGNSRIDLRDALVRVQGLSLRAGAFDIAGRGTVSLANRRVEGEMSIEAKDMSLTTEAFGASTGLAGRLAGQYEWAHDQIELTDSDVLLRDLALRVVHGGTRADFAAPSVKVGTPRLRLKGGEPEGHVVIDLPSATAPDLAALQTVVPLPSGIAIEQGSARMGAQLNVELPSGATSGSCEMVIPDLAVRLASKRLVGNLSLKLRARDQGASTDLSGSTLVFDSVPKPTRESSPPEWWARAELTESSQLRIANGFELRANLHARAKDASPAAALIANRTPIPRWLLDAVPMNDLEATCEIWTGPSLLEVRSLVARGHEDLVQLEYANRNRITQWALLLEAGIIHAGLYVDAGGPQFVLFGVRPWFEEKAAALRVREFNGR